MESSCINSLMDYNEWSPNYGNLPMEIILHIFRFLNHSDLQAAGATCSRWREALFVGEFNRNIVVHFVKVCLSDRLAPAKFFLKCQRPYRSFCLEEVTFGQAQELLTHIGKTATEMIFDNADMGDKQFYAFMRQLTHLESLTVTRCSPLFMSGSFLDGNSDFAGTFSNIRHLSLKHNQYLSDAILLRLTSLIKGIETLDMSGCHIAYHNAIHRRFYPNDSLAAHPSESILTFKFLARVANLHRNCLKELNLSHTMISGPALQSLTSAENIDGGLALQRLRLTGCRQLNTSGVKSFLLTQPNLVLLDLADTLCVKDDCVAAIVDILPKLKTLNVAGCGGITNAGAILLGNLKQLQSLNISRCDGITTDGLTQGIARSTNYVLKYLYMSHLIVCEESIKCIARNCPELRILNVGHCVNGVTDTSVQCIIEHLRWLRELSLEDCFRVTDAALTGINISKLEMNNSTNPPAGSLENFHPSTPSSLHERENIRSSNSPQTMKISLRSKAEEDIVRDANRKRALFAVYELNQIDDHMIDGFSIQQLKGLRSLNLKGCNKITDVSLKYGLKFIELQRLYLSNCQQITLLGMETLVLNCPSIEEIDLSDCYNINDKTIQLVTAKLSRLRALHISGCTQLTDHSLDAILVNCKCLQTLSIYRCRRMYSDIEDRLADLTTLRHLNMDNTGSLDNVEFFRLKKRLDY
ncbi:F-box/LRR-repeat protein 14 [Calliphora vicina]|uniref:F-box/LRR-repeat protein 14 n=1 Tax=Calliphora vicina TaxID=7373 RepID=UPI00325C2B00